MSPELGVFLRVLADAVLGLYGEDPTYGTEAIEDTTTRLRGAVQRRLDENELALIHDPDYISR